MTCGLAVSSLTFVTGLSSAAPVAPEVPALSRVSGGGERTDFAIADFGRCGNGLLNLASKRCKSYTDAEIVGQCAVNQKRRIAATLNFFERIRT